MAPPLRLRWLPTAALVLAVMGTAFAAQPATAAETDRDYYEWRTYQTETSAQRDRVLAYLETAALPAWKRAGAGPVGVFTETGDDATAAVHALLTFGSADVALTLRDRVAADPAYQNAAADYLAATMDDPAFGRIESTLMVAFTAQPRLTVPDQGPRVFEMRTYESHSEAKAARKIEMFNSGEAPIFREAGFTTVFFGESLVGPRLPNLKYMVAAPDMAANEAAWRAFRAHPDWEAMMDLPKYADTVSHIDKLFLAPAPFSEL